MCNLVYALLMQRQRDIKYAQESEQMKARLTSSLSTSESARSRLENRLQAQERSIGALENRVSIFFPFLHFPGSHMPANKALHWCVYTAMMRCIFSFC